MTTSEIDGAHGLPRYIETFTNKLQQVLHDAGQLIISNAIKLESAQRYACRIIQCVNRKEEETEGNKRKKRTGMIKVLGLIHNRANQSDPRLAWFMPQKIYLMYSDIKKKDERNASMLLTRMSEHKEPNKVKEELKDSRDNDDNNQLLLQKMIIPSDINDMQPRATQVRNYDEVGFDPNGRWNKIICTYKIFQGE